MRVLFLVPYPTEGASNRIRVEQFIPYLTSKGVVCRVRPFVNRRFFRILYLPHRFPEKVFWFVLCTLNRILDVARAISSDVIFIHREAYPFGAALIESFLSMLGKKIIFDFDDSIFLSNTSESNIYIERFKKPGKTARIIRTSDHIIAGNKYLADYALQHNPRVSIIPSSVDTSYYKPISRSEIKDRLVVGWVGSNTTKRFLYELEDVFEELSKRYRHIVFNVVGATFSSLKLRNVENIKWSLKDELAMLQNFDIGIMPMPDNKWTKGKCGFKAILYMACGIPVIASPVGVNLEIVEDGVNGFFGKDDEDWYRKLSILIEDKKLRQEMGKKGREKVVEKYSFSYAAPLLYENIRKVFDEIKR